MTIKIYPGQMPSHPIEQHPWKGTISDWFAAAGIDYGAHDVQPVTLTVDGEEVPVSEWATTTVTNAQIVEIRPKPFGAVGKLISKVFNFLFGWLMPKTGGSRNDPGQGKQLQSAEGKANTAKLNQTVPELFGHFIRYPDYLVPPRRYFAEPRVQNLEMLLCIGPGQYEIDLNTLKIGNTPLQSMEGAEFTIHPPGADLSAVEMAQNWYPSPEVGGTSAGTAGLDLTASPDSSIAPTGTSFVLSGGGVITSDADFPSSWGVGTAMSLLLQQPVTVTLVNASVDPEDPQMVNEIEGDWREIAPEIGQQLNVSGAYTGSATVRSVSVDSNGYGKISLLVWSDEAEGEWIPLDSLPLGSQNMALSRAGRVYAVQSVSGTNVTLVAQGVTAWAGFAPRTVSAAQAQWDVQPDTVYGEQAGPFVLLPASETTTTFDVDFFFPQGLHYIDEGGNVLNRSVGVSIDYRSAGGGAWQSLSKTYTLATLDQVGFTERINVGAAIRPEVRIRRRGARSSSTQVQDVIQWYAARSLLPAPTSYPWTTLSLRVRGLGQIAASSENQVNLEATRILPTLQPNGAWGAPVPTRDISAALWYVCSTIGYGMDNIDMSELVRLHNLWTSRGETFDAVLDEMTVQQSIEAAFAAGMAELTIEDGRIKPVREVVRTVAEQSYSAQNTLPGGIRRAFTVPRPDDNDGVEVEFQDESDGWATDTVQCMLPGSLGLRLEKIKLQGVTDRTRAWRIGMRRAREQRYRRWSYTFGTELDALNSSYGGFVSLVNDQSAILEQMQAGPGGLALLHVTEPLRWKAGQPHVVALRRPDGSVAGPWPAMPGGDDYELLAPIPEEQWPLISLKQEPPHVYFGPQSAWTWLALVRSVKSTNGTCQVQAVNYDPRVYEDDNAAPSD